MHRGTGPGRHPWFASSARPRTPEEEEAWAGAQVTAFLAEARQTATVPHDPDSEPGFELRERLDPDFANVPLSTRGRVDEAR